MLDLQEAGRLWKQGKSASEIGGLWGITRNAALGRLHRAGYLPRESDPDAFIRARTRQILDRLPDPDDIARGR